MVRTQESWILGKCRPTSITDDGNWVCCHKTCRNKHENIGELHLYLDQALDSLFSFFVRFDEDRSCEILEILVDKVDRGLKERHGSVHILILFYRPLMLSNLTSTWPSFSYFHPSSLRLTQQAAAIDTVLPHCCSSCFSGHYDK